MAYNKKQKIGIAITITGALTCLILCGAWFVTAIYWHSVTGSWLDYHITEYEFAVPFCIAGIFFFTRVVAPMFDV